MLMTGEIEPVEYFENPIVNKRGDERVIAWHNTIIRGEKGDIIATLSSGNDITDPKNPYNSHHTRSHNSTSVG
jgi:hypothetical protein